MTKEFIFTINDGKIQFYLRIKADDIHLGVSEKDGKSVCFTLNEESYWQMVDNLKSDPITLAFRAD